MRPLCRLLQRPVLSVFKRGYNEAFSMECLYKASKDWHKLVPDRTLNDEAALRAAFDKLDLNGNGKIDAFECVSATLLDCKHTQKRVLSCAPG